MRYTIHHTTTYQYPSPVSVCQNVLMLTPRKSRRVNCLSHRLKVRPTPAHSSSRVDSFGNTVNAFSIEESHHLLSITASSRVELIEWKLPADLDSISLEAVVQSLGDRSTEGWFDAIPFLFDSPRISPSRMYSDFVRDLAVGDTPIVQAIQDINRRIHVEFEYDKTATQVDTPTEQAFHGRAGVCQDFAHIAISCLRSIGIPARYVSGYLRTTPAPGKPRLIGTDQSHAWISAWCGQQLGWIDFDPTNDCICHWNHIPIAWGRDYSDVVPIRGVFLGSSEPAMKVSVDVASE